MLITNCALDMDHGLIFVFSFLSLFIHVPSKFSKFHFLVPSFPLAPLLHALSLQLDLCHDREECAHHGYVSIKIFNEQLFNMGRVVFMLVFVL